MENFNPKIEEQKPKCLIIEFQGAFNIQSSKSKPILGEDDLSIYSDETLQGKDATHNWNSYCFIKNGLTIIKQLNELAGKGYQIVWQESGEYLNFSNLQKACEKKGIKFPAGVVFSTAKEREQDYTGENGTKYHIIPYEEQEEVTDRHAPGRRALEKYLGIKENERNQHILFMTEVLEYPKLKKEGYQVFHIDDNKKCEFTYAINRYIQSPSPQSLEKAVASIYEQKFGNKQEKPKEPSKEEKFISQIESTDAKKKIADAKNKIADAKNKIANALTGVKKYNERKRSIANLGLFGWLDSGRGENRAEQYKLIFEKTKPVDISEAEFTFQQLCGLYALFASGDGSTLQKDVATTAMQYASPEKAKEDIKKLINDLIDSTELNGKIKEDIIDQINAHDRTFVELANGRGDASGHFEKHRAEITANMNFRS